MGSDARTFLTTPQSTRSYLGGMAANRWTKCPQCNAFVYWKRLEKNSKVCPECNYHFHMGRATLKCHLAGFPFLWHDSVRLYTYRLVAL